MTPWGTSQERVRRAAKPRTHLDTPDPVPVAPVTATEGCPVPKPVKRRRIIRRRRDGT
jgi:hypothetical protein